MAIVPGQLKDEEDDQVGGLGAATVSGPGVGGTPSVGGTVAGSSAVAQNNGVGGGAGTGFVNIDRYIGANRGASKDVVGRGNSSLAKDGGAFDGRLATMQGHLDEVKPTMTADQHLAAVMNPGSDAGNGTSFGSSANNTQGQSVSNSIPGSSEAMQANAIAAAQKALGMQTGITGIKYDVGQTEDAKKATALGNAETAGKQIAADNGTLASYGTGLQAIDRAIYGSQDEGANIRKLGQKTQDQFKSQQTRKDAFGKEAADTQAAIAKNKDDIRNAFMSEADKIKAKAQAAADAANAATSRDYQDMIPTAQDRAKWEGANPGDAKAEQFLDASGLNAIGKVLGDSSLSGATKGPEYVGGKWVYGPPQESPQQFEDSGAPGGDAPTMALPDTGGSAIDTIQSGVKNSTDFLAGLLGAPVAAATDTNQNATVGEVPTGSVLAPETYTTQQIANATRGLSQDQLVTYRELVARGMSPNEAANHVKQSVLTDANSALYTVKAAMPWLFGG